MVFVQLSKNEYKVILPLLQHLFTLEGKNLSLPDVKKMVASEISSRYELFALKEGASVAGCVGIRIQGGHADLHYFAVAPSYAGKGYGELLLQHTLDHCIKQNVLSLSCTVPRVYELLFVQKGFFVNREKIHMELKRQTTDQQVNLKDTFQDLTAVQDIAGVTAQKLRKLKTR